MKPKSPATLRQDSLLTGALPEMDVRGKKKDYPSINDYYKAASRGEKPIQYQHGLANYSCVQLGDDRISFKKSLTQDEYRLDVDTHEKVEKKDEDAPGAKTYEQRREDYAEANNQVGINKIHEMEQMMRDKLQQRTKTGPFQLRKTFKYFDRDGSGGIDFSEFQLAMELMGFQFTEIQQLALFARYDENCSGEVDYNDFVEKVMESDFKIVHESSKKSLKNMVSSAFASNDTFGEFGCESEEDDSDEEELEELRRKEIKNCFDIIDSDNSGYIDMKEFDMILKKLGKDYRKDRVEECFRRIDGDMSGRIEFSEFYMWYKSVEH